MTDTINAMFELTAEELETVSGGLLGGVIPPIGCTIGNPFGGPFGSPWMMLDILNYELEMEQINRYTPPTPRRVA